MRTNTPVTYPRVTTHEGGPADRISAYKELRRSVLTCLLWEDGFYETGAEVAKRISELCTKVEPQQIADLAIEARDKMKLRHVPLFLIVQLTKHKKQGALVTSTANAVIQRADELAEVLSMYWKDKPRDKEGRRQGGALGHRGLRVGLDYALRKFNEYNFAKYNRDNAVKLRDVLRLVHPKPESEEQKILWGKIKTNTLETPDTWEVALSAGNDKKETFERLLREKKMGALAVLRNLRNMQTAKVEDALIRERLLQGAEKALPFRFITAARYAPSLEDALETCMFKSLEGHLVLHGRTGLLVDVSASMDYKLSEKSEATRVDAAAGLAMLVRELCAQGVIATFSNMMVEVPPRRGFALRDAIHQSQPHSSTQLKGALEVLGRQTNWSLLDRLIVISDEQSADGIAAWPYCRAYLVNVGNNKNGVSYKQNWIHIDGWSENVINFIQEYEAEESQANQKASAAE